MSRQTRSSTRSLPNSLSTGDMSTAAKAVKVAKTASTGIKRKMASGASTPSISDSFQQVKSQPKKRKPSQLSTALEQSSTSDVLERDVTPRVVSQSSYTPTLLPPLLSFSLEEAKNHLETSDPRFTHFFSNIPCKPFQDPLEAIDPFKTLVTSIIGQQVSWMAARAITKRFRELFGYENEDGFPSPRQVSQEDVLRLKSVGLSLRKAEYVISLAQHFDDGRLSTELLRDGTDEEISKALIAVRGIGQWTVDMFLMFSLRRPDVMPVGDLGVQKGLLRWVLAAHGALPKSKSGKAAEEARKKYGLEKKQEVAEDKVDQTGSREIDTVIVERAQTPQRQEKKLPPTLLTPSNIGSTTQVGALHTPAGTSIPKLPETPLSPGPSKVKDVKPVQVLETASKDLPPSTPETFLDPMPRHPHWDINKIAPLDQGLSVELMKSRLSGKKAKGGVYLTPPEMELLTRHWRPYRSLATYYMWPAGEEF